jgi:hypothetical protein
MSSGHEATGAAARARREAAGRRRGAARAYRRRRHGNGRAAVAQVQGRSDGAGAAMGRRSGRARARGQHCTRVCRRAWEGEIPSGAARHCCLARDAGWRGGYRGEQYGIC